MISDEAVEAADAGCGHLFIRSPRWWLHRKSWMRYECVRCQFLTRRYDSADFTAMRPVHPHMSVALPVYNTMTNPYRSQA